jgi:hypothetical protein
MGEKYLNGTESKGGKDVDWIHPALDKDGFL